MFKLSLKNHTTDHLEMTTIKGVNNTQFVKPTNYKEAVTMLIENLATAFEQSTVTTTWSTVEFVYTTKQGESTLRPRQRTV